MTKRIRVIAGPNGSGKSTLFNFLQAANVPTGPFVNADHIAKLFSEKSVINLLSHFGIECTPSSFDKYLRTGGDSWKKKAVAEGLHPSIQFTDNNLLIKDRRSIGYDAAMAADFIRHELVQIGASFTFETVLSHHSKVDFLNMASGFGYRIYLYFVSTVSPSVNLKRIEQRVQKGGHEVADAKVNNRYDASLGLLPELATLAHRSFIFDNSVESAQMKLFAEIDDKKHILIPDEYLPWWVVDCLLKPLFHSHKIIVQGANET